MVGGPAKPNGDQKKEWGQRWRQPAGIRSCDGSGELQTFQTTENSQP